MKIKRYDLELGSYYKPQLVEEGTCYYSGKSMTQPEDIAVMLNRNLNMDRLAEERIIMIAFTANMLPLGVFEVGKGTAASCLCSPREMLVRALLTGAVNVAIVHNHPSGSLEPSVCDDMAFEQIQKAMTLIGINLIDFIIVGNGYLSYKESGRVK